MNGFKALGTLPHFAWRGQNGKSFKPIEDKRIFLIGDKRGLVVGRH